MKKELNVKEIIDALVYGLSREGITATERSKPFESDFDPIQNFLDPLSEMIMEIKQKAMEKFNYETSWEKENHIALTVRLGLERLAVSILDQTIKCDDYLKYIHPKRREERISKET